MKLHFGKKNLKRKRNKLIVTAMRQKKENNLFGYTIYRDKYWKVSKAGFRLYFMGFHNDYCKWFDLDNKEEAVKFQSDKIIPESIKVLSMKFFIASPQPTAQGHNASEARTL